MFRSVCWKTNVLKGYSVDDNGIIYPNGSSQAIQVIRNSKFWNYLPMVNLNIGNRSKAYRYDHLIAYTFHGYYDDIVRVTFADNNKDNCHPSNIRWLRISDIHNKYKAQYNVDDVSLIPEEWKPYSTTLGGKSVEISNLGKVRNSQSQEEIAPNLDHGYLTFHYNRKSYMVHRMVGELFVENPKPHIYTIINHLDGNKSNNKFYNLEWCTISMNNEHGYILHEYHRFDEAVIHQICQLLESGVPRQDIATITGTSKKFISKIATGYRHRDISQLYNLPDMKKSLDEIHGRDRIELLLLKGFDAKDISYLLQIPHDMQFISYCYRVKLSLGLR